MRKKKAVLPSRHVHSKKMSTRPSYDEPHLANTISRKIKLSEDVLAGAPIVTGYGKQRFCIENYRNIIEYTEELIRIQTKSGKIHLIGKNLAIAYYRDDSMCVVGNIQAVEYH